MTHTRVFCLVLAALVTVGCGGSATRPEDAGAWPGRVYRLPPWRSGVPALLINVPEAYGKGLRAESSFLVHLFRRPPDAAPADTATLAIYVGLNPRDPRVETITESTEIAGRNVSWVGGSWPADRGRTMHHAEAYVRGLFRWPTTWRSDAQGLVVHVMVWGTDAAEVERLMEAAKSLRLEP